MYRSIIRLIVLAVVMLAAPMAMVADDAPSGGNLSPFAAAAVDAAPSRVSLLVATPGTEVYELEGHAGLRLRKGFFDVTINWGVFDFDAPNFVYRFVKGDTDYMCAMQQTHKFLHQYEKSGRGVYEFDLNLDSAQIARLEALVFENLLPQNRIYRYNYVKDNCSTRPLAMIEKAVGDTIVMDVPNQFIGKDGKVSYRDIMRFYHKYYPWYQFGIDLALGDGIDYPISRHDMAFAPILLPELLHNATIGGKQLVDGDMKVVVKPQPWQGEPTPWYLTPLAAAILLLVIATGFSIRDLRRRRTTRWFDTLLFLMVGLLGCVLTFLVLISSHEATTPNWLILWLNPFALIVPIFIWLKNGIRVVYCYNFLNFVAILLLSIAWPFLGQEGNIAFIPLLLADVMRSIVYMIINRCALRKVDILPE